MFDVFLSLLTRLAATAVLLGWLLSTFGALTLTGYLLAGLPATFALVFAAARRISPSHFYKTFHRLAAWWTRKRKLPLLFLLLGALIALGSVLHEPNNFDGLSYRTPRVLCWLDAHRWHWINTLFEPTNYMMANYEWLVTPLLAATNSLHITVGINWLAFALLPPLMFSLLRQFGTHRRVAYDWMWVFPSGYLLVMLAGGIGNDLLGLTAILAALHFARRFNERGENHFLRDALIAAGFATGVKLSNLPLVGFVLLVLLKNPTRLFAQLHATMVACVISAAISGLVPLTLNCIHTGSPLGTTSNTDQTTHPIAGWLGNGLIATTTAMAPPIFPGARQITAKVEQLLPMRLTNWLQAHYPKFTLAANELPQEEGGALGLGITLTFAAMIWLWWRARRTALYPAPLYLWQRIAWVVWLVFSLAALTAKLGTGVAAPRNLLPWFALGLAPAIGFFSSPRIGASCIWRGVTVTVMLSALPALLLTPSRPLIPPAWIIHAAHTVGISPSVQTRLAKVYDTYALRADPFADIRKVLPADNTPLGLISHGQEPAAAWWKPWGQRHCEFILSASDLTTARGRDLRYVVIENSACEQIFHTNVDSWLASNQATAIRTFEIPIYASQPPWHYTLAQLNAPRR